MAKFNGRVTLTQFKKAAVQLYVYHSDDDKEWQEALVRVRTWKEAAIVLPRYHPMRPIACGEEV